jgi:hypothetical protein
MHLARINLTCASQTRATKKGSHVIEPVIHNSRCSHFGIYKVAHLIDSPRAGADSPLQEGK